jgi:CDP-glycerol glycerophosphotransferase (TagB/SpsB family)
MKEKGLPVFMNTTRKSIMLALKARYYVSVVMLYGKDSGNNLSKYMGGVRVINLWHGIPLKKIAFDDKYHPTPQTFRGKLLKYFEEKVFRNTYHIATSPGIAEIYRNCFRADEKHVLVLGQARNDYFYTAHTNPYKERFDNRKIILYMPTHRREGKQVMDMTKLLDLSNINTLCKKHNAIFLIKKHFYHSNEESLDNSYENIIEITNEKPSAQVLLDCADLIITDYSSCYIDYLLLDRPILFYSYDLEDYLANDREMYFDYKSSVPGPICENKERLEYEISSILEGKDVYKERREYWRNFFYSKENQQQVSKKQIDAIMKL